LFQIRHTQTVKIWFETRHPHLEMRTVHHTMKQYRIVMTGEWKTMAEEMILHSGIYCRWLWIGAGMDWMWQMQPSLEIQISL